MKFENFEEVTEHITKLIKRKRKIDEQDFKEWFSKKNIDPNGKYLFDYKLVYICYLLHKRLRKDLDNVIVVTGEEGSGKSSLGIQINSYLDTEFNVDKICLSVADFVQALRNAVKGDYGSLQLDEGGDVMFSRDAMSRGNKIIVKQLMNTRFRNLTIIIMIPNFFMLDPYTREHRVRYLLHVKKRGQYRLITKKGISRINRYAKNKDVMGVSLNTSTFFDGKFSKRIPTSFDWDRYNNKKNERIMTALKTIEDEMIKKDTSKFVTIRMSADALSCSIVNIHNKIKSKEIKAKKIGSKWFIPREEYDRMLEI